MWCGVIVTVGMHSWLLNGPAVLQLLHSTNDSRTCHDRRCQSELSFRKQELDRWSARAFVHNVFPNDDVGARLYARLYGPAITRREVRSIVSQSMDPDVATSKRTHWFCSGSFKFA